MGLCLNSWFPAGALHEKVSEPLVGGDWLEEVHHYCQALMSFSLPPVLLSLCPAVWLAGLMMVQPCLPCYGGWIPWNSKVEQTLVPPKVASVRHLSQARVRHTPGHTSLWQSSMATQCFLGFYYAFVSPSERSRKKSERSWWDGPKTMGKICTFKY